MTTVNLNLSQTSQGSSVQEPPRDEYIHSALEALKKTAPPAATSITSEVIVITKNSLIDACSTGDLGMIKILEGQYILIDKYTLKDNRFLDSATPEKCLAMLKYLADANLDFDDESLGPFFDQMLMKGDAYVDVIGFLIDRYLDGPDSIKDENGNTLIALCKADNPQKKLIRLFIEKGADIYAKDAEDSPLLQIMCKREKKDIVALLLNKSEEYAEKFIEEYQSKFNIGHINGMGPRKEMNFEGGTHEEGIQLFSSLLEDLPKNISEILTAESKQKLASAFANATNFTDANDETVAAVKRGDLVIMPLGYDVHSMCLVFSNGYMAVCNRGGGLAIGAKMLEAHRIDPTAFSLDILKKLLEISKGDMAAATDYYYKTLPAALSASKDGVCAQLEGISLSPKKPQKIGNCTYASAKLALRAATTLLHIKKVGETPGLSVLDTIASKKFSKAVSTHIRLCALDEYFEFHENNKDLQLFDPNFSKEALALADKHLKSSPVIKLSDYPYVLKRWGAA